MSRRPTVNPRSNSNTIMFPTSSIYTQFHFQSAHDSDEIISYSRVHSLLQRERTDRNTAWTAQSTRLELLSEMLHVRFWNRHSCRSKRSGDHTTIKGSKNQHFQNALITNRAVLAVVVHISLANSAIPWIIARAGRFFIRQTPFISLLLTEKGYYYRPHHCGFQ